MFGVVNEVYLEYYLKDITPNACMLANNMFLWSFVIGGWVRTLGQCRSIINSLLHLSIHIVHLITTCFFMMLVTSMHGEQTSQLQHQCIAKITYCIIIYISNYITIEKLYITPKYMVTEVKVHLFGKTKTKD